MATSTAEASRVLVLGPDKDSKLAVVSKLHELCGDSNPEISKSDVTVLNLQTKYYRAAVEVHVHQVRDNAPEPALQHELHDYEAVICVVDAGQHESFLHVDRFAKRIVDVLPYDVCLVVAGTSSATKESVKKINSWCQVNGFEFVDLDGQYSSNDDEDSVVDEKQGVERVLEALHCNMWRSMEMNPPKEVDAALKVENATPEEESEEKKTVATEQQKSDDKVEKEDKNVVAVEQEASTDDSRLQALLQALEIAGGPHESGAASGEVDDEEDIDMAQFSALISEVRNVRDQGESLTDEQRRERAAEVAMKLWNFLGADDDDEDASD